MSQKIFDSDLVAIRKNKVILTVNKPAYVGICILDLSKVLMSEFHDQYIKNKCGNNSKLLFADTNSLLYKIKTEDVYEGFSKDTVIFEFSAFQLSQNIMIIQTNQWLVK